MDSDASARVEETALGKAFTVLMLFNAALTAGAVVLLTMWPTAIPTTVGFPTVRETYPMGYMLAAAEVGLTILFLFGRQVRDRQALQVILWAGAGFHVASALAQIHAMLDGLAGNAVGVNITLRMILACLLAYYAFIRVPGRRLRSAVETSAGDLS